MNSKFHPVASKQRKLNSEKMMDEQMKKMGGSNGIFIRN